MTPITEEDLFSFRFEYDLFDGWHDQHYRFSMIENKDGSFSQFEKTKSNIIGDPIFSMEQLKERYTKYTGLELNPGDSEPPPNAQ